MRRVHIQGIEYQYEIGASHISVRNTITQHREVHRINDIVTVCGGDVYPVMPRHVKFFLMRKMGIPTPLPWSIGDLLSRQRGDNWSTHYHPGARYLVISLDDEFVDLFSLASNKREKYHMTQILPNLSQFAVIKGS